MIYVVLGTKAQLIKMAPVMCALRDAGTPYTLISTGQHRETMDELLAHFNLPPPGRTLYQGPDIVSIPKMLLWATSILWQTLRNRRALFPDQRPGSIVLVHGDTFSTLLGALMGRIAGIQVGHVESGLRSFNLFHPFPEELTRLITFRLADVYFCPGAWATGNVRKYRGRCVDTEYNTLLDALGYARRAAYRVDVQVPPHPFALASLHRFENVFNRTALERVVGIVERIACDIPMVFILHKPTEKNLHKFGLYDRLASNPRIELRGRYDYFRFIRLLDAAEFVVSDGGSNQEECFYLGKPVLLLREATERQEGLGLNCVLSRYEPAVIDRFVRAYAAHRQPAVAPAVSPSARIAGYCAAL
jgi:UDP-N-acetylglucosamine 2-epimerase (non-hydrolysing)